MKSVLWRPLYLHVFSFVAEVSNDERILFGQNGR